MLVLVINCGSSSLKFQLINTFDERIIAKGAIEEIGLNSRIKFNNEKFLENIKDHDKAFGKMVGLLLEKKSIKSINDIDAFGHRVVHGGEKFSEPIIVDEKVISEIEKCSELAPLHNPANLIGIRECMKISDKPNVVIFDTAFHQTMKKEFYLYPLSFEYYKKYGVRKYGFHGTSHKFILQRTAKILGKKENETSIVSCHLGNGSSLCAIENGKSVNTTMGFTPLDGLMVGTRSGSIDPAIITFLMKKENLSIEEMDNLLNKKSGALGLSGISSDFLELEKESEKNELAKLAIDKFSLRVRECLGSMLVSLNKCDAIVFTAGRGENSPETREYVCKNLDSLGIILDKEKNNVRGKEAIISSPNSKTKILVIPTNEELMIAKETEFVLSKKI